MEELRIYFGGSLANLYDVGYLSTDIYQLIAFSELVVNREDLEMERWFGDRARPFNRYASIFDKYRKSSEIKEAKGGSLELAVSVASLATSIIVPLAMMYLQKEKGGIYSPYLTFEISARDQRVQQLIHMFGEGNFGHGPQAIDALFSALRERGYNVELRSSDAYVIHNVLERYSQRMIKTISRA